MANPNFLDSGGNGDQLKKQLLRSMIFAFSTFLFALWIFFIHINWGYIQNIRQINPIWLVKGVYPWLYIIILAYILLFLIILNYDLKGRIFHLIFITYLVLIIDSTPYILSTYYRFVDTVNVATETVALPDVLAGWMTLPYPKSFPGSYMLFYTVRLLTDIDLTSFSIHVFSPLVLVAIFSFWYLFATHLFDARIAFLSTIIAIPSLIIEISITPNSLSTVLLLMSLFLCTSDKWESRVLFSIVAILIVLTHSINTIITFVLLVTFYIYGHLFKSNKLHITETKIYSFLVIWLTWILSKSCIMGNGIVKNIWKMLTMESTSLHRASTYTTGSGNLGTDYSWIQSLTMFKYELYALVTAVLIAFDLFFICYYALNNSKIKTLKEPEFIKKHFILFLKVSKIETLKESEFTEKYFILFLSVMMLALTLVSLILGGVDTQNIIGRTLNIAMLFISLFIALSFSSLKISLKPLRRVTKMFFIVILIIAFITYPLYSYGRDSYINFPKSQGTGSDFVKNHVSEGNPHIFAYTKAAHFYHIMENKSTEYDTMSNSTVYMNGWYSLYYTRNAVDNEDISQILFTK